VSGADRISFLQGQLTQDIERVAAEPALAAAWCSPKGRVVVTLRLVDLGQAIGLVMPAASVDEVARRLTMYRLRAKVELSEREDVLAIAFSDEEAAPGLGSVGAMPASPILATASGGGLSCLRLAGDTLEVYGTEAALAAAGLDPGSSLDGDVWRKQRILTGLVDIGPGNAEKFTPHMLNLDCIGALSFNKGCYTGQEVVARTQHLGKVKRRINLYRLEDARVETGDRLCDSEGDVAEVVNACLDVALAVAPVDRHTDRLAADGGAAVPLPLPYPFSR